MIVLATCAEYREPTPSLQALLSALTEQDVPARHLPWTEFAHHTVAAGDIVLPICCWDYHRRKDQFLGWIATLEAIGVKVINAPVLLRWNLRKTYLLELKEKGVAVPETIFVPAATPHAIRKSMQDLGWRVAVLKPVSGQSGYGVQKLELERSADWDLGEVAGREALLQAYQADISALGETTLTLIDGEFSHAVRRNIAPGEWRANLQYGTVPERVTARPEIIASASRCLQQVPGRPLYARVDGIVRDDGFVLTELELIEPYLYLELAAGSADRIARCLRREVAPGKIDHG